MSTLEVYDQLLEPAAEGRRHRPGGLRHHRRIRNHDGYRTAGPHWPHRGLRPGPLQGVAGTGSNATTHAITLSKEAEKLGADGLLLVSPYYNKATEAGLIAHYTAIGDQVHLPCIVYNVPSRTGVNIPVSVYQALSHHPNFCGVKEASGDIVKIARIRQACGPEFSVWSGNDDQVVPVMALGGHGIISVVSNLYPETMVRLAALCMAGPVPEAANLQAALMPAIDALFCEVNPIPIKAALRLSGLDVGHCRLPLTDPTPEHLELLKRWLGPRCGRSPKRTTQIQGPPKAPQIP